MSPAWGAAPSSRSSTSVQGVEEGMGRDSGVRAWGLHAGAKGRIMAPTWHDALLALLASRRVLLGVAVSAEQLVLLGSEWLVHEGAPAP